MYRLMLFSNMLQNFATCFTFALSFAINTSTLPVVQTKNILKISTGVDGILTAFPIFHIRFTSSPDMDIERVIITLTRKSSCVNARGIPPAV